MIRVDMAVAVYCASSPRIDSSYLMAASRLGELLANNAVLCINGAGKEGLMGSLNNSILKNGGRVRGIIPRFMVEAGWCHDQLTETIITDTIHQRKELMAQQADAVIALPGGIGTLEELVEIITWRQLGLYRNPIILLNINNYYKPLLMFFELMISEKFMDNSLLSLFQLADTVEEAVNLIGLNVD